MRFPLGYYHSRPIPKHAQQNNKVQMQIVDVESHKNSSAENWASLVNIVEKIKKILKTNSQYSDNQTKMFLQSSFKMPSVVVE